jgi:hypothetical protein
MTEKRRTKQCKVTVTGGTADCTRSWTELAAQLAAQPAAQLAQRNICAVQKIFS